MTRPDPLAAQCTATSKSTGKRCQIRVLGGGPCRVHGGSAEQVRRKREERIIVGRAALDGAPVADRTPAEVMVAAMRDADSILQKVKAQVVVDGKVDPLLLNALGDWVDRAARIAKTVVEGNVMERQQAIVEREAETQASAFLRTLFWPVFEAMSCMGLTRAQRDAGVEAFEAVFLGMVDEGLRVPDGPRPDLRQVPVHPEPSPQAFTRWAAWQTGRRPPRALSATASSDPTIPSSEEFL